MQTIICIGSGPSLTPEDCLRANDSELSIIAVNNSWTAAGGKNTAQALHPKLLGGVAMSSRPGDLGITDYRLQYPV